jgi:NAD-dependent dihydropyrimidine dehydrogenase PreA subunit
MIKNINELQCINCGLCEDVCPMDIFRRRDGKVYIAYPEDCCNCQRCLACPVDAIIFVSGVHKQFDTSIRWQQIKEALNIK